MNDASWSFDTTAVHAGRGSGPVPDPSGRQPAGLGSPVAPAIQPSASYSFDRLADLNRAFDDPGTGFVYARHGAPSNMFGVKIGDLKPIPKKIKGQQALACELYATGNSDAMIAATFGSRCCRSCSTTPAEKLSRGTVPAATASSSFRLQAARLARTCRTDARTGPGDSGQLARRSSAIAGSS